MLSVEQQLHPQYGSFKNFFKLSTKTDLYTNILILHSV